MPLFELEKEHCVFSCTELDLPPSEWPEIKALSTYEWIQRQVPLYTGHGGVQFSTLCACVL